MEISANLKTRNVSAFLPHVEDFYHWCSRRKRFEVVEHRGYVCDAENVNEAMCDLLKMVRAQNQNLSDLLLDDVKFKIGAN